MSPEHQDYTPLQQVLTEHRDLYSERIREDGAHIGSYGSLLLSDVQLERVQQTGDPLPQDNTGVLEHKDLSTERQQWLMTQITDLQLFEFPRSQVRVTYELKLKGVATLQDALIFGRGQLLRSDSIGPETVQALEEHINASPYGFELVESPTARDMAVACTGLEDVKLKITRPVFHKVLSRMPRGYHSAERFGTTMHDLLVVPGTELVENQSRALRPDSEMHYLLQEMSVRVQARATEFAREFYSAR